MPSEDILSDNKKFAEFLVENNCSVCALGACLISKTKLYNHTDIQSFLKAYGIYISRVDCTFNLGDIFEEQQIDMIEAVFEGSDISERLPNEVWEKCYEFYTHVACSSEDRLVAIMENIIINNGEFIL